MHVMGFFGGVATNGKDDCSFSKIPAQFAHWFCADLPVSLGRFA